MYFVNNLTDDDFQRVHDTCPDPPPAMLLAGSFAALLEAIDSSVLMRRSAGHASHSKRSVDLTGLQVVAMLVTFI